MRLGLTRDQVTKPYRGHCDETKVKSVQKTPILIKCEQASPETEKNKKEQKGQEGREEIVIEQINILFILFFVLVANITFLAQFPRNFPDCWSMNFPELGDKVGKYPSNVRDDTESEGNAYQGKQEAENPTRKGGRKNVSIT